MKMKNQLLWIGAAAALLLVARKKNNTSGIGAVKRAKRRVFEEMQRLQENNIPLDVKYIDLTPEEKKSVERCATLANYKQPASSSKSYGEAYYNSVRRQYMAVAGTDLPYKKSTVYNQNGDPIVIYRNYGTEEEQLQDAITWYEDSIRYGGDADDAFRATLVYIAQGGKFIWSKDPGGVLQEVFATTTKAQADRKSRISYLASEQKGGKTVLGVAHFIFERYGIDDQEARNGVCDALLQFESVGQVREYIVNMYFDAHKQPEADFNLPF